MNVAEKDPPVSSVVNDAQFDPPLTVTAVVAMVFALYVVVETWFSFSDLPNAIVQVVPVSTTVNLADVVIVIVVPNATVIEWAGALIPAVLPVAAHTKVSAVALDPEVNLIVFGVQAAVLLVPVRAENVKLEVTDFVSAPTDPASKNISPLAGINSIVIPTPMAQSAFGFAYLNLIR